MDDRQPDRMGASASGVPLVPRAQGSVMGRADAIPALAFVGLIAAIWGWFALRDESMGVWGVSAATMASGEYENLFLSMLAHGGIVHLAFNSMATLALLPPVIATLGHGARAVFYAFVLFLACGLGGSAGFLALNPSGIIPAIGASGALYGLIGYLARLGPGPDHVAPLFSMRFGRQLIGFLRQNMLLVIFTTVPIFLSDGGGIAWEAHLGGFVTGLLLAPLFFNALNGPDRAYSA
ncbi:rhomboid family intramembrane serine protease [Paraurantiacibacter namhicola]|nr:rhomboid family intramembrane serine protease [Paraurantiacibacter namhicola]